VLEHQETTFPTALYIKLRNSLPREPRQPLRSLHFKEGSDSQRGAEPQWL